MLEWNQGHGISYLNTCVDFCKYTYTKSVINQNCVCQNSWFSKFICKVSDSLHLCYIWFVADPVFNGLNYLGVAES